MPTYSRAPLSGWYITGCQHPAPQTWQRPQDFLSRQRGARATFWDPPALSHFSQADSALSLNLQLHFIPGPDIMGHPQGGAGTRAAVWKGTA